MFIKYPTQAEAEAALKEQQAVLDENYHPDETKVVLAPPIPVADGSFAIEECTDFGQVAEVVQDPISKEKLTKPVRVQSIQALDAEALPEAVAEPIQTAEAVKVKK